MTARRFVLVPAAALVFASSLVGCKSASSSDNSRTTVVQTVTAGTPNSEEGGGPSSGAGSTDGSEADGFVMPNEVGKNLQEAQDHVQNVADSPLFQTDSTDATGQGRSQFYDRNWKVCSQNVKPGTRVSEDTHISFAAVKNDEACP